MFTYTGKEIDPVNPQINQIDISDIAHALSMICRANGHFKHFYSVGQHSINCCLEAKARGYSEKVQLACLLHDAAEAYIADLIRPVKEQFAKYTVCEEKLKTIIFKKYGITHLNQKEQDQIKSVDDDVLFHEFMNINNIQFNEDIPRLYADLDFSEIGYDMVEKSFLIHFTQLLVS